MQGLPQARHLRVRLIDDEQRSLGPVTFHTRQCRGKRHVAMKGLLCKEQMCPKRLQSRLGPDSQHVVLKLLQRAERLVTVEAEAEIARGLALNDVGGLDQAWPIAFQVAGDLDLEMP